MRVFASAPAATRAELLSAPVRWPRPARLREPLDVPARRLAEGLRALGIESVGELLEHLPRDRREARAIAQLRPGEQATVAVEVRSIAARSVRRRGMRPLVEAIVFDETGSMGAAFFNQPWLVDRYRPGTRLLLHGKRAVRGALRGRPPRARRRGRGRDGRRGPARSRTRRRRGPSPTTQPRRASARRRSLALVRDAPRRARRHGRAAAGAACVRRSACPTARRRSPRCTSRAAARRRRAGRGGSRSRSCCWRSWRSCAAARCAARGTRAGACRRAARADRALAGGELPFALTGDQAAAIAAIDADLAQRRADAAAAEGRRRLGQDRGRAVRAAARGRARARRGR